MGGGEGKGALPAQETAGAEGEWLGAGWEAGMLSALAQTVQAFVREVGVGVFEYKRELVFSGQAILTRNPPAPGARAHVDQREQPCEA